MVMFKDRVERFDPPFRDTLRFLQTALNVPPPEVSHFLVLLYRTMILTILGLTNYCNQMNKLSIWILNTLHHTTESSGLK